MEHRFYVEELIANFGYEQLTANDDYGDSPEARTHFEFEYATTGVKATGVEHIPEVSPNKD